MSEEELEIEKELEAWMKRKNRSSSEEERTQYL
jgi:hypothetical protein